MYGQYSELKKFARDFASQSRYRREVVHKRPLTIEEAKLRKSRYWRKLKVTTEALDLNIH